LESRTRYVNQLNSLNEKFEELKEDLYKNRPVVGYFVPMLAATAIENGNSIVDTVNRYSSADHNVNFRCLLQAISECIDPENTDFTPFFDSTINKDKHAESVLSFEWARLKIHHDIVSANQGLWDISETSKDNYEIKLSSSVKRTALHLLRNKADFYASPKEIQELLKNISHESSGLDLTLKNKLRDLEPLTVGVSEAWKLFLDESKLSDGSLLLFQALVPYLNERTSIVWFKENQLIEIMTALNEEFKFFEGSQDDMKNLLTCMSTTLDESLKWGLTVPFVRFGQIYMRWPFAYHVIHPNLTLLAILMKRNPNAWNNTVGSCSAKVANYLLSYLDNQEHLKFATCKVKKRIGDIDIAVLDEKTNSLLLCEVKTVFDRFRTNHQSSNFTKQRVNYEKAANQLIESQHAIESGKWKLSEIFGNVNSSKPDSIYKIVLTWWDIVDLYKETDNSDIATTNFSSFIYVFNKAFGDIEKIHRALIELSSIYCPSVRLKDYIKVDDLYMSWSLEKQTDALPPSSHISRKSISSFSSELISDIASFPDDWQEQLKKTGNDGKEYILD